MDSSAEVDPGPDDTVLIGGAARGVGVFAVQLARIAGARVVGTGSRTSSGLLRDLGAEPLVYGEGLADRVRALAPGGVTAAVDLHGTETVHVVRELGVPDDRICTIAGQVHGVSAANGANAAPGALDEVARLVAAGELEVPIAASFPIEEIRHAAELQAGAGTCTARSSSTSRKGPSDFAGRLRRPRARARRSAWKPATRWSTSTTRVARPPSPVGSYPLKPPTRRGRGAFSRVRGRRSSTMIEPYQVVGLIPTMRGIRYRDEIKNNIEHLTHLVKAASWLSGIALPVRLITIPEGALQGFNDEVLDHDHEWFAQECAIDIPGPETDALGEIAAAYDAYVMATAKARHPEFPGRFFNVGFAISPQREIVLKHYKVVPLSPVEHSVTPHNVWDRWTELYGDGLDAFYPVADTEIGRLGVMMANEASYPENARGLAMNGCEVAYRGPYPHPHAGNGFYEIQNKARALDNNMYVVANQVATYYLFADSDIPIDTFGSPSMVCDYRGSVVGEVGYAGHSTYMAGTIDIQALRDFRSRAQFGNWMKDLTTEQYQAIYREPIFPKNLYLDRKPYDHAEYRREVTEKQIELLHERDVWRRP